MSTSELSMAPAAVRNIGVRALGIYTDAHAGILPGGDLGAIQQIVQAAVAQRGEINVDRAIERLEADHAPV